MTVLAKTCLVCTKAEFDFIAAVYRNTQYLSIPSVSSVKIMLTGLLFWRAFCQPFKVTAYQWLPWRAPIGQWGPGFAPTGCVAHWCAIGHCVGIVAAPRGWFLPPMPIPPNPSIINTDGGKGQQKIPWNSAIRDRGS